MKKNGKDDDSLTVFFSPEPKKQFAVPISKKPPPAKSVAGSTAGTRAPALPSPPQIGKFSDGMSLVEFEEHFGDDHEGIRSEPGTTYYVADPQSSLGVTTELVGRSHLELATTYRELDVVLRTGLGLAKEKRDLLGSKTSLRSGQYSLCCRDEIYRKKQIGLGDFFSAVALLENSDTVDLLLGQAEVLATSMCDEADNRKIELNVLREFAALLLSGFVSVVRRKTFLRLEPFSVEDEDEDADSTEKMKLLFERTDGNCTAARNLRATANTLNQRLEPLHHRLNNISDRTKISTFLTKDYRISRYSVPAPDSLGSDGAVSVLRATMCETAEQFRAALPAAGFLRAVVSHREFVQALRNKIPTGIARFLDGSVSSTTKRWSVVEL